MIYWQGPSLGTSEQEASWLAAVRDVLSQLPSPVFLESAGEMSRQARYSYFAAEPEDLFQLPSDPSEENRRWRERLNSWLELEESASADGRFAGAYIGYAAYDLGRWLEKLPSLALNDVPIPSLYLGRYHLAFVHDRLTRRLTLEGTPGMQERAHDWLTAVQSALQVQRNHRPGKAFRLTTTWRSNMTEDDYRHKFSAVQDYIRAGDCYQVNLAQRWQAGFEGSPLHAYDTLLRVNGAPFSAYLDTGETQLVCVSPERFLALEGGLCETRPIKGTRPRHPDPLEDRRLAHELAKAEKDRAENVMIVDLLRNDLSRSCKPGSVKVTQLCEVESYPSVHHLVSTIQGELSETCGPMDLFLNAFPGGSITGAPKIRAMEIIEELEPHRRQAYCGSFLKLDLDGTLDSNIAIRTLLAHDNQIYCWAGGGLVADSQMDLEYQETRDKVSRILPLLADL
jgi:para-aminobenzoate synthetase component 1